MARNKLIQFRRDTAATWTSVNPLLESGETGFETDTKLMKIGDGVSLWTALPYFKDLSGYSLTSHNHTGVYEPVDATLVRAPLGVLPVLDGSNLTGIVSGVSSVSGTAPVVSSGGATPVISMAAATALVNGYMTSTYASKLDGIETSANNYVLPASVVHDTESGALHATDALRVSGTALSLYKGDGTFESVNTQDTVYTHPTTDGNLHVPATSTTNSGKVLTAGATAGSISWVTPSSGVTDHTLLTNIGTRTHAQLESDIAAKAPLEDILGAAVASATTTTIGTAGSGSTAHITGTTTITSFGVSTTGTKRTLIFDGILSITQNATSMILPAATSITTAVGDVMEVVCENGALGYWRCTSYVPNAISITEQRYIDGLTSSAQTQLDSKLGATLAVALNTARATVASHATTAQIWTALGNQIDWTGTATTTAFPNAPQAGAERTLICAGACSFTAGTNMLIDGVVSGATVTCATGDTVIVRAISTTQFKLTRLKADGTSQVSLNDTPIVLITTITANVSATIDITGMSSTYDDYIVTISNYTTTSGTNTAGFMLFKDGASYDTGANYNYTVSHTPNATFAAITGSSSTSSYAWYTPTADTIANMTIYLYNVNSSLSKYSRTVGVVGNRIADGIVNKISSAPLTGIRLYSTTNIITGTFKLYGIKK